MPRKKRQESPTGIYHWITRGINKMALFRKEADHRHFKDLVLQYKQEYRLLVHHYCLMTNHIHMLVWSETLKQLSDFSHYCLRRYAYYYCKSYQWSGAVFQKGYKAQPIDREVYLLECGRYIERNPLKALLAREPGEYRHSSFRFYANGNTDPLLTSSPAYLALSDDDGKRRLLYAQYVSETRPQEEMAARGIVLV